MWRTLFGVPNKRGIYPTMIEPNGKNRAGVERVCGVPSSFFVVGLTVGGNASVERLCLRRRCALKLHHRWNVSRELDRASKYDAQ